MRDYEFTVIFGASEEQTSKGTEAVSAAFAAAGVQVTKQEDLGIKNFAYIIKKQDKGHYCYYELTADPQVINKLNAEFLLEKDILKFLFVVKG